MRGNQSERLLRNFSPDAMTRSQIQRLSIGLKTDAASCNMPHEAFLQTANRGDSLEDFIA